jgi:fucose permease
LYGGIFTVAGAALPGMIRGFGWSYTVTGVVLAAAAAGFVVSTMVCGYLVQRIPPKMILVCGLGLGAVSMFFFAHWSSPELNFLLYFCVGLCQGAIEVVSNLEVIHMESSGQSRLMTLMHAVFSIGAIAAPAAVGVLVGSGASGTAIFPPLAGLLAVMGVLFAAFRFPRFSDKAKGERKGGLRTLGHPLILLVTLLLFLYVGAEVGVSTWIAEYQVKVLGAASALGAFTVSLFWAGICAGRVTLSYGYRGTRQERLLVGLSLLATAALAGSLAVRSSLAVTSFLFLVGLGCSGIYPLSMSVVGKYSRSGVAVGAAATGGGLGTLVFPLLMALLSEGRGPRGGFLFAAATAAAVALCTLGVFGWIRGVKVRGG